MSSRIKILNSDKEVNAFKTNMKEQRCLTKNLMILDAEASYSCRLLDLDSRVIRVFFKRFKEKVTKIKSKLTSEEISKMKMLEERGLLPHVSKPISMSGALKIADAEKRLKLPQANRTTENAKKAHVAHEMHRRHSLARSSIDSSASIFRTTRLNSTSAPAAFQENERSQMRNKSESLSPTTIKISPRTSQRKLSHQNNNAIEKDIQNVCKAQRPTVDQSNFVKTPRDLKDHEIPSIQISQSIPEQASQKSSDVLNTPKNLYKNLTESESAHVNVDSNHKIVSVTNALGSIQEVPEKASKSVEIQMKRVSKAPNSCPHNSKGITNVKRKDLAVPRISDKKNKPRMGSILHIGDDGKNNSGSTKHVTIAEDKNKEDERSTSYGRLSAVSATSSKTRSISAVTRNSSASSGRFSCHNSGLQQFRDTNLVHSFGNDHDDMKIGGYIGEDPYEERRKDLMKAEREKTETIRDKQSDFIERLDQYLEEQNKQNQTINMNTDFRVPDHVLLERRRAAGVKAKATRLQNLHKRMQRNSIADAERMQRVFDSVQDVNKCRYLRISSDKIDLSGIVTLASEQMKLLGGLKFSDSCI